MEWVRSAYIGTWRLFRAQPHIETVGRYIFAGEGARHYPAFHNFFSRNWTANTGDVEPTLGERVNTPQKWTNGQGFGQAPAQTSIGSADCIANGERWPLVPLPVLRNGVPVGCYFTSFGPVPNDTPEIQIARRATQVDFASVLDLLYTDPAAAQVQLQQIVGPSAVITFHPWESGLAPRALTAVTPDYTVMVTVGTMTEDQMWAQIMGGIAGPFDYGPFSTNAVWWLVANGQIDRLQSTTFDPSKPLILVGHSYGGALSSIVAARYQLGGVVPSIQLLSYGAPKPGDARLATILRQTTQIHLVNRGDPTPDVPPSPNAALGLVPGIPPPLVARWGRMAKPWGRVILDPDGTATESQDDVSTFGDYWQIITEWLAGDPITPFAAHDIKEYLLRLMAQP